MLLFLAVAALFGYAFVRSRARRRKEFAEPETKGVLPPRERTLAAPPAEKLTPLRPGLRHEVLPTEPTAEAEAARRAADEAKRAAEAAEEARLEAKRLIERARSTQDAAAARTAEEARDAAARAREEAETKKQEAEAEERKARELEEERKKDEYRKRRAAEHEDKERRRREAEEARLREEEAARERAREQEERKRKDEEEQRRKVAAEAGKTLAEGLSRTRGGFVASLNAFFGRVKVLDESVLGELEEVLFGADIGVQTSTRLLEFARDRVRQKDLADAEKLKGAIREEVARLVDLGKGGLGDLARNKPFVVMVVGVNGSGKTTTIGKLAARLTSEGQRVLVAAGDTFRAAAVEQLSVWVERVGVELVKGKDGSDPGAVIFDAIKKASAEGHDVVLCDTAGRLHTKAPLMEELRRVRRVMDKALPGAPHEVLLVVDATNGQNAIAQAREFHAALQVSGMVLTKLDGTAKGGVVIGICDELKLPVRFVGIGEAVADLRPFDPREYVQALFD